MLTMPGGQARRSSRKLLIRVPRAFCLTLLALSGTQALLVDHRTVKKCDTQSALMPSFGGKPENCKIHCWHTYIGANSDVLLATRKNFHYELTEPAGFEPATGKPESAESCCCYYEVPWPKEFTKPEYLNLRTDLRSTNRQKPFQCYPIVISINLTKRTKDTYNILCELMGHRRPLTMLEASKFVEAAAYLNYMQPKHPVIWKTLKSKDVIKLDDNAVKEFRSIYQEMLIDIDRPLGAYGGSELDTSQLREFAKIKQLMPNALRSPIIAMAVDEYLTSYMLVDVAMAAEYIQEVNYNQLALPDHLLNGYYDKYDESSQTFYFQLEGLDCNLLSRTQMKLSEYLSALRALSAIMYRKLVYEMMGEKCDKMIALLTSEKIYGTLMEINCGPRAS